MFENITDLSKVYLGDCLQVMNDIPDESIDCIICDLPYGITSIKWDVPINLSNLWNQYNRILKDNSNIILFASGEFTYRLYQSNQNQYKYKLIWKKNVPTGMSSAKYRPMKYYEEILIFQKGKHTTYNPQMKQRVGEKKECYRYDHYCSKNNHLELNKVKKRYDPQFVQPSDVLEFDVVPNRKGKLHPTEKPIPLLEWLIRTYSNDGEIVLDNCCGSGSTGVACLRQNRNFIGIEINDAFYKTTVERLKSEVVSNNSRLL